MKRVAATVRACRVVGAIMAVAGPVAGALMMVYQREFDGVPVDHPHVVAGVFAMLGGVSVGVLLVLVAAWAEAWANQVHQTRPAAQLPPPA